MRPHGPRALASRREKPSRPVRVLLRRMIDYLGKFRRIVALGAVLSIAGTAIAVFDPLILRWGIDNVFSTARDFRVLLFLVELYIIFKLSSWLLRGANTWVLSGAQAGFVRAVQVDVYDHLVRADLSYHKSEQSGNVTSRVTTDTVALGVGIQVMIDFASQALMLVASFIMLWITSAYVALASLVVVPGVIFITVLFGTVGQRIMLASQRAYGQVSGQIAENLAGIHVAKAFNREEELAGALMRLNQKAYKYGFRFMMLMSAMQPLVRSMGQFAVAAVLFVGGTMAVGATPVMTVGEIFLGVVLLGRFMWPLLSLSMMATQVQSSLAAMDRISDVLEAKRAISDREGAVPLRPDSDGITFDHVTFWYREGTEVLKDVSFTVRPGETVALVGHTGAGKTTIAALINRFYDPQKGRILIGDQDLRDITLESLHGAVALVPQEPYLFDGTILENIRYGRESATDEEVIRLCKMIGADEFIEVLADGYHTMVVENGKNLSAGQRQMIAIARTMLADPRILVLDEATSRLDAYSEALVQDAQAKLFADRTTVVIAHRLTTVANASRILVFQEGRLVEQGTQDELLAQGGVYKALYDTYYAHQGVEEITVERLRRAEEVVAEESVPAQAGALGPGPVHGSIDGHPSGAAGPAMRMMEDMSPDTLRRLLDERGHMMPSHVRQTLEERLRKHDSD